jgi:hypothetical protein
MTRPHKRRAIGAGISAVLLLAGITSIPTAASAGTVPGVSLDAHVDGWQNVNDGAPSQWTFTVTNHGRSVAKTPTLSWLYKDRVQPKPETNGGLVNVHVKTPKAANCNTNTKTYTVTCHFKPLKSNATTKVTLVGTADAKGATDDLGGAYIVKLGNGPISKAPEVASGGWVIFIKR